MSFNICEFFVGAGGSHLGFMRNGFESIYVNDFDKDALKTLLYNNKKDLKNAVIDNRDFTQINPKELQKLINKDIDLCFGGIVCKGFSLAGERSPNDSRNFYYQHYLDIIKELKPKISIIENVKAMLGAKILSKDTPKKILERVDFIWQELENFKGRKSELRKKNSISKEFENYGKKIREEKNKLLKELEPYKINVIDDIIQRYDNIGYRVKYKILNAAYYGSGTKRQRLIIVALRKDLQNDFVFPKPEFYSEELGKLDFDDLHTNFKKPPKLKEFLSKIDYDKKDKDNEPMKHSAKTIERFKYIKAGKNLAQCYEDLPAHLKISNFFSRGNAMRLDFEALAPTLVPGHSNFPIHPSEHRSITIREAAVITGFPLNYKFFGSHSKRCEQVGNAVPPPLSLALAKAVKNFLEKEKNEAKMYFNHH